MFEGYGYRFVNTKFTVFGWIPFWDVICLFAIYWEMFGVPAVAQYSVGWSVFHGAHTAVLGIGFFGIPKYVAKSTMKLCVKCNCRHD